MPKVSDVHVAAAATNFAIRWRNLAFVIAEIMPIIPVLKESDKYAKFYKEELRRINTLRAMGAESREVSWAVTHETYTCEEYALKGLVADRLRNNADKAIKPELTLTKKLLNWILLDYEYRGQQLAQDTGNVGSSATPDIKWDGTSPTIEDDIDTAKNAVRQGAGVLPNKILMTADVKDAVKKDSTIRNLIRYTMPAAKDLLKSGELPPVIFNLKTVIANSIQDTANEGQTASISDIWNDNVWVGYVEPTPDTESLTWGFTMRVRQGGKLDVIVTKWRESARKGDMIEPSIIQDEKVCATDCAYLITDSLT